MIDAFTWISLRVSANSVMSGERIPTANAGRTQAEVVGVVLTSLRSVASTAMRAKGSQAVTTKWSTKMR